MAATPAFFHKSSDELLAEADGAAASPTSVTALALLPSVTWRSALQCGVNDTDLTLSPDRLSVLRAPGRGDGPRVALCDRWLTRDCTEVTLHCEHLGDDVVIGVVDHNFMSIDEWWKADLTRSRHATVVHLASGHCYFRGRRERFLGSMPLTLPRARMARGNAKSAPVVTPGDVLHIEIDQRRHEMTVELRAQGDSSQASSVVLDELPSELVLAIGLGSAGRHCVRILDHTQRPADSPPLQSEIRRELWDPENRVLNTDVWEYM